MTDRIKIGVIFGGRSGEHEVSLMSARSVLSVLDATRYEVTPIGITRQGGWVTGERLLEALQDQGVNSLTPAALLPDPSRKGLYALQPGPDGEVLRLLAQLDVVFPVLHGTFGEDGTLQGLLELADVAYVGAGVLGSAVGMDKILFKDVMRAHGIPVVESVFATRGEIERHMEDVLTRLETLAAYPLFVKPANLGSSVGVSKCHSRSDLYEGLMDAARYDRRVLVERGVNAREIEVSVLGNNEPQASTPGEILPSDEYYTYAAKYLDERSELIIPARLSPEQSARCQELAVRAFKAIDCAGMARVDFLLDRDNGELYVSEINTIPGFTKISMYPKLWDASGLPYPRLVERLVELALERKNERDHTERSYGGRGR